MAVTVYRFRWRGCDLQAIKGNVNPAVAVALVAAMPKAWMDVSLDPGLPGSPEQEDLNKVMLDMGWLPFSTDPATPLRAVTEKQEIYNPLTVDESTTVTSFTTLLTTPITTDVGFLDIEATISGVFTVPSYFQLTLDGVAIPNGGCAIAAGEGSTAIFKRIAIAAGAHTVELEWMVSTAGLAEINPVSSPNSQNASLFVKEVVS